MKTKPLISRGPGSLFHRLDAPPDGWGPSGCTKCGWRGAPTFIAGVIQNRCPSCEGGEDDEEIQRQLVKDVMGRTVGRNDPCFCGSGTKFKRCCGR